MNSKNLLKTISFVCAILVSSSVFAADLDEMQAFEASFQQLSSNFVQTRSVRLLASAPAPTTVAEETTRATAAETSLQNTINNEISDRKAADQVHEAAITANATAISGVDTKVNNEISDRKAADQVHEAAITANATAISGVDTKVNNEISDRKAADQVHEAAITANATAIAGVDTKVNNEISDRKAADQVHEAAITANATNIGNMNFTNTKYIRNDTDLSSAVRTLDANFAQMSNRLDDLNQTVERHHKEMKRGFASLAAMTRLVPNARSGCDTQLAIGMGSYRGSKGFAVGAFHYIDNNTLINAGVGYAGHNSTTFGVGLTFGF